MAYFLYLLFRVNPVFGPDIDGLVIWFAYIFRKLIIVKTPESNLLPKLCLVQHSLMWFVFEIG